MLGRQTRETLNRLPGLIEQLSTNSTDATRALAEVETAAQAVSSAAVAAREMFGILALAGLLVALAIMSKLERM